MSLIKITFDASSVSSKMDADIIHFLANKQNGIFTDVLGRCQASVSNSYISFQSGYIQVYGRRIFVESGTRIALSLDGSAYGYVIVKIDLGNNELSLELKEALSAYPVLTQEDLMNGGLIYEFPLTRYTKTASSVTLDANYVPPSIKTANTYALEQAQLAINDADAKFSPVWQMYYTRKIGSIYVFESITSTNAGNGIIGIYFTGCYVTFAAKAIGGSGGVINYRYLGNDYQINGTLSTNGLFVEDSRGSIPKYVTVTR